MTVTDPTDELEQELRAAGASHVAGVDEVGRGAWAGPLVIGALIPGDGPAPAGIRDSKLLRPTARARLEPAVQQWATAWAVGQASPAEIDDLGMAAALTLAARRALDQLAATPDAVILDGPHDYIGAPWAVTARAKADLTCTCVAAASILAKEHRDRLMRDLAADHPQFALDVSAGYPSPTHRAALLEHGPVEGLHRMSWKFVDDIPGHAHRRHPGASGQLTLL